MKKEDKQDSKKNLKLNILQSSQSTRSLLLRNSENATSQGLITSIETTNTKSTTQLTKTQDPDIQKQQDDSVLVDEESSENQWLVHQDNNSFSQESVQPAVPEGKPKKVKSKKQQTSSTNVLTLKSNINKKKKSVGGKEHMMSRKKSKDELKTQNTGKRYLPKLIINVYHTKYEIVRIVAKEMHFRLREEDPNVVTVPYTSNNINISAAPPQIPEFDLLWLDLGVLPEVLTKLKPHQRMTQCPGIYNISRKNNLARNLMKMKKLFPTQYNFFPHTFQLPHDYNEFKNQFMNKKARTYIVKPEAQCQGKGIFLTKTYEDVTPDDHYVVQKYLTNPLLIDGLKFDLRLYVLVFGVNPLRAYIYKEGLARFATEPYQQPTNSNMDNLFMHLTNYAINKHNGNYVYNQKLEENNVGHKRSLKAVFKHLQDKRHYNTHKLWANIKDVVNKTLLVSQPQLNHLYRSCQPDDVENQMCFHILGIDIILDDELKPWLLEVNQSPSLEIDTPLDYEVKHNLIKDTLTLVNLNPKRKWKYIQQQKLELQKRILTGKIQRLSQEEKEKARKHIESLRDNLDIDKLGDYEQIYPITNNEEHQKKYDKILEGATDLWEQFTTGTRPGDRKKIDKSSLNKPNFPKSTWGQSLRWEQSNRQEQSKTQLKQFRDPGQALTAKASVNDLLKQNLQKFNDDNQISHQDAQVILDQLTQQHHFSEASTPKPMLTQRSKSQKPPIPVQQSTYHLSKTQMQWNLPSLDSNKTSNNHKPEILEVTSQASDQNSQQNIQDPDKQEIVIQQTIRNYKNRNHIISNYPILKVTDSTPIIQKLFQQSSYEKFPGLDKFQNQHSHTNLRPRIQPQLHLPRYGPIEHLSTTPKNPKNTTKVMIHYDKNYLEQNIIQSFILPQNSVQDQQNPLSSRKMERKAESMEPKTSLKRFTLNLGRNNETPSQINSIQTSQIVRRQKLMKQGKQVRPKVMEFSPQFGLNPHHVHPSYKNSKVLRISQVNKTQSSTGQDQPSVKYLVIGEKYNK